MTSVRSTAPLIDGTTIAFSCDYAKSSNARCHGKNCEDEISKGTLRLSRLIVNPFIPQRSTRYQQRLMPLFYHVNCFVNYLRSGNEKKKRISNVQTDFQDFDQLKRKDQQKLIKLFDYERTIERNLSENSTTVNTTYLEHQQDGKFWQISIENKSTKTKYGLLNEPHSNSIFLLKEFSNQNQAQKYFDTKIKEKLKRGYSIQKQITPKRKRLTTRSTTNKKKN